MPVNNGWHVGPPGAGPPLNLPVMIWYDFKSEGVRPAKVKSLVLVMFMTYDFLLVYPKSHLIGLRPDGTQLLSTLSESCES